MKTFNIIKKNRKYYAAKLGKAPCKILIDVNSDSLALGEHTLEVEDISVRSKYGTDLIFKLAATAEEQEDAGICTLRHYAYNSLLVNECRKLGGKWDGKEKAWIFSGLVADKVDELDEKFNDNIIPVEVTFKEGAVGHQAPYEFCGITVARAFGRDSGATLGEGVSLIDGSISSGGSMKNWLTRISEGAVIRLEVPAALLADAEDDIEIKKL